MLLTDMTLYDAYLYGYERGQADAEPQWIPCKERLPELRVYVIATTQWYEITMACRIGDGEWFINEGDTNAYDDDVIAWMPLPEPYREGE